MLPFAPRNAKRTGAFLIGLARTAALAISCSLIIGACGATHFFVPVMRPAEVNLLSYKAIALGSFTDESREARRGNAIGFDIADEIIRALLANSRWQIYDLRNRWMMTSDRTAAGELLDSIASSPGCLLTGRITQMRYDEAQQTEDVPQKDKPPAKRHIRRGTLRLEIVLELTDLKSSRVLWNRRLQALATGTNDAIDAEPSRIDVDALRADASATLVGDFIQCIMPTTQQVSVTMLTDDELPLLATGVQHARRGNWNDAIAMFTTATERYARSEEAHKAWFDLGVAYQYSYDFRHAAESLQKALALKEETLYKNQLERCYAMEKEYIELLRQQSTP